MKKFRSSQPSISINSCTELVKQYLQSITITSALISVLQGIGINCKAKIWTVHKKLALSFIDHDGSFHFGISNGGFADLVSKITRSREEFSHLWMNETYHTCVYNKKATLLLE